jgi:hypothetical protein
MPRDQYPSLLPLAASAEPSNEAGGAGAFYEDALPGAMRPRYRRALDVRGFDGEIALLRLRLHGLLTAEGSGTPDSQRTGLVLRIIDLLLKASRLAPPHADEQATLERAFDEEALRLLAGGAPERADDRGA